MRIIHSEVAPSVQTIASNSESIFPRFVPPNRQRTPIGRKTSGSNPALSMSALYSTGWRFSFFPFSPCVCVLLFNRYNEPALSAQRGRITATAKRDLLTPLHCWNAVSSRGERVTGCSDWLHKSKAPSREMYEIRLPRRATPVLHPTGKMTEPPFVAHDTFSCRWYLKHLVWFWMSQYPGNNIFRKGGKEKASLLTRFIPSINPCAEIARRNDISIHITRGSRQNSTPREWE